MKKIFTFFLLIISYVSLNAQKQPKGFHLEKPVNMASILASKSSIISGFSSVSEARSIINDIMDVVAIQQNFKVVSTTQVDNAAAVIYQNVRYILYNPSFIDQLDVAANDKWASISVIGHEIGHHLLGHTMDGTGSQIPKELAADEFSGLVLRKMGASLQQAQLAMEIIGSPYASATHPAEKDRLLAISKGWNSTSTANNNTSRDVVIDYPNNGRTNYPTTTYPKSREENTYPSGTDRRSNPSNNRNYPSTNRNNYPNRDNRNRTSNQYPQSRSNSSNVPVLVYDIKFTRSNGEQYFITAQNDVVRYQANRLYKVAKIANTNSTKYPYVIYDDKLQLYVNRNGNIFTDNGKTVGYITRR